MEYRVPAEKVAFFKDNGFVVLEGVVGAGEVARYNRILAQMLDGSIDCSRHRGDLGGHAARVDAAVENCVQICHPYAHTSALDECEHFRKGASICDQLFGGAAPGTFGLDCSQLLVKPARTATETPWHQDQSYYPAALPDLRAANVWLALADVTEEMGCMAYKSVPLSARELSPHRPAGNGKGALTCGEPPAASGETTLCPVKAGSVIVFASYTYHRGLPNRSNATRPAFVAQFRPKPMIQACREMGFDHGKFDAANDGESRTTKRLKLSQGERAGGAGAGAATAAAAETAAETATTAAAAAAAAAAAEK